MFVRTKIIECLLMKNIKKNKQAEPPAYTLNKTDNQTGDQKILGLALRRAFSVSPDEPMSPNLQNTIERLKKARAKR